MISNVVYFAQYEVSETLPSLCTIFLEKYYPNVATDNETPHNVHSPFLDHHLQFECKIWDHECIEGYSNLWDDPILNPWLA